MCVEATDLLNGQWSSDLLSSQHHEPLSEWISKLVCVQLHQVCNTFNHCKSTHKSNEIQCQFVLSIYMYGTAPALSATCAPPACTKEMFPKWRIPARTPKTSWICSLVKCITSKACYRNKTSEPDSLAFQRLQIKTLVQVADHITETHTIPYNLLYCIWRHQTYTLWWFHSNQI